MGAMTPEQVDHAKRATERAKALIKPGDRISRTMCGGVKGTFTFTHWYGDWMCGQTVDDCHALHVYRVNGKSVSFHDEGSCSENLGIKIGKHYRRSSHQYAETRKVYDISDGIVYYVTAGQGKFGKVKAKTFADTFGYELPPHEPASRYSRILTVDGQAVWYVFKDRYCQEFWYSLDGQAIYSETPLANPEDHDHHFDIRVLPEKYTSGLDILGETEDENGFRLSLLERARSMRAAHVVAIGRALADGFDLRANQQRYERRHQEDSAQRQEVACPDPRSALDDLPF